MAETPILDVRSEIPQRRHELIFEHYHALKPGESYILLNDHDPIPLYYQFESGNSRASTSGSPSRRAQ